MSTPHLKSADFLESNIAPLYDAPQWQALKPLIDEINVLKQEKNAVILGHNYMTPDIFHGVSDITGDSLKLAQEAAKTDADVIVQAGVHFMAETSKILCPDKTILMPDMEAGCSLAEGITANDVKLLKEKYPGVPIVTYVNTSAEVKAESDVCCTSSNAAKITRALYNQGHDTVLLIPDQYLAENVAAEVPEVKVLTFKGSCIVHERFTANDMKRLKEQHPDAVILAHPECPKDVVDEVDYSGSTSQMDNFIKEKQPAKAILVTECSMSDNLKVTNPNVTFISGCQLCPYMKKITLPKIRDALKNMRHEIHVDEAVAARARIAVERMLELSV